MHRLFACSLVFAALFAACGDDQKPSSAPAKTATAAAAAPCAKENLALYAGGRPTMEPDRPAYPPYFEDDDPTNGKGFESAVAYAVARELGFDKSEVKWTTVPFNSSYAPGEKKFD